jgi:hypothetical protein
MAPFTLGAVLLVGKNIAQTAGLNRPCNALFETDVRERAAVEFSCASGDLTVEDLGGWAYRVVGCGVHATYECDGCSHDACVRAAHDDPTPNPV